MVEKLRYTKVRDVKNPVRGHKEDAGIDFYIPNDFKQDYLLPKEDICIPSGIKVIVPKGYALIFKEKSGVALNKKLTVGACVVDCGYTGEVHIHLFNNGNTSVKLLPGEKIIQAVLVPVETPDVYEISNEDYARDIETINSLRGEGGFGSTGVN